MLLTKDKIYPLLGITPDNQSLTLHNASDAFVAVLNDETATLGQYGTSDNWLILVRDGGH